MIRQAFICGWLGTCATAQGLQLPANAVAMLEEPSTAEQLKIAIAATTDSGTPAAILEGTRTRSAWSIDGTDQTTLSLLLPLIVQLEAAGFTKTLPALIAIVAALIFATRSTFCRRHKCR